MKENKKNDFYVGSKLYRISDGKEFVVKSIGKNHLVLNNKIKVIINNLKDKDGFFEFTIDKQDSLDYIKKNDLIVFINNKINNLNNLRYKLDTLDIDELQDIKMILDKF